MRIACSLWCACGDESTSLEAAWCKDKTGAAPASDAPEVTGSSAQEETGTVSAGLEETGTAAGAVLASAELEATDSSAASSPSC